MGILIGLGVLGLLCALGDDSSSGSSSGYSECDDYTLGDLAGDVAEAIIVGSIVDSAYKRDVEAAAERQRLLEKDPMAEFRI
ncbi:MAG: hypothetical protein J6N53_16820 [Lachnospiraceae bacterium]|nr:hypothetical protein [Lachnospiraceae bacterium]